MSILRKHPIAWALLLLCTAALAFQAVRSAARRAVADTQPLANLVPQGALLSIESPDFAGLLERWNKSAEQKRWLVSGNYSVFSNSRLFGRLADAETEFAQASEIPAATLLPQVAGRQSLFAWYDVGNLDFLYITRMSAAQAARTDLVKNRGKWKQREAGGTPFYLRTSSGEGASGKRTVAFASVNGLFLVATREDLLAGALELLARNKDQSDANSLATEPWFQQASAALPVEAPSAGAPMLHMELNLERIVPLPQFRSYWVQQNISEMKQYRAAVADLYSDSASFREERALLPVAGDVPAADPDLAPLAALAPTTGVFRASATTDPADAVAAIEEKLLGRAALGKGETSTAPDPTLDTAQVGSVSDLEKRIDAPPPVSASASNELLRTACKASGFDGLLTWSSAQMPASAAGLWVPIHAAVALHGTATWNPQTVATALQSSLRGSLTTATFGIEFRPSPAGASIQALTGPKPLFFAVAGPMLLVADDQATLQAMLASPKPASPQPATLIAGFNHTAQRGPFARLTSLIDGTPQTATTEDATAAHTAPSFFSGNLRSLSDTFVALDSEQILERHADSPSGPIVRQTVVYRWKP